VCRRQRNVVAVALLLALSSLFACKGGPTPTSPEPRRNALSLSSIEPAEGSAFRVGDSIQVTATLRYSFAEAPAGSVAVFAYPGQSLPIGPPLFADPSRFAVQGRQGEITLRSQLSTLDDGELQPGPLTVSFTLFPEGVARSQTFVEAHYQLVR
jgi:hypothetical protein